MVCTNLLFFFFWNNLASRHQQQARLWGFITNSDLFRPLLTRATVMKYRFGGKKKKSWGSRGRGWQRAPNKPTSDTDNLRNVALMTSAEAVNRALRGLCVRLQQRKKNWGAAVVFLHLANKKIEIVSVSSFLIWYYVTSRKQRHGLLTGTTREQMVCVGSSAVHQHTLHFIFFW